MFKMILLLTATFIWGLGFVGTRWTLIDYSPIWSNSLRFVFAGVLCLPFLIRSPELLKNKGTLICSVLLAVALQLQTIGIAHTSLAKSGFLTVFYALFTPLLVMIFYGKKFKRSYWLLLSLALFGIALLCELEWSQFNAGDLSTLASAFFFALHILAIDHYGKNKHPVYFNFSQCFYIGVFCLIFALLFEGPTSLAPLIAVQDFTSPSSLYGFVILSIFSSLIAFSLQISAQQSIPPHIVSLLFLTESIFAAFFGYLFFNEHLSLISLIGCLLVLISVALIPILTRFKRVTPTQKRN